MDGTRADVCVCTKTNDSNDVCDGVDNDCNGVLDDAETAGCSGYQRCIGGHCACGEENTCGAECVDKQTNPRHCGQCGNACDEGAVCEGGNCTCHGTMCGDVCVDTTSDNANCNGCGMACGVDNDCSESACIPADREWTRWPINDGFLWSPNGDEVVDRDTHLVWKKDPLPSSYSAVEAAAECAGLPHPADSEWRLPTRAELLSIVDFDHTGATAIAPGFTLTYASQIGFWTSTPVAESGGTMNWWINFTDGRMNPAYVTTAKLLVRCVRQDLN
jgi:hypothetical protein